MVSPWVDAFLYLRDRKVILLAQINNFFLPRCMIYMNTSGLKSHLLITQ